MDTFLGAIQAFAFPFAPSGWAQCNGGTIGIQQNTALFALLGVAYGGDGVQSFGIPDLRGRTMVHQGTRPGGAGYVMGQNGGNENATLVTNNLPPHNHAAMALNGNATSSTPGGNVLATAAGSDDTTQASVTVTVYAPANSASMTPMDGTAIGMTGSSVPFSTLPPYLTFNVCIALQGIFPPRS